MARSSDNKHVLLHIRDLAFEPMAVLSLRRLRSFTWTSTQDPYATLHIFDTVTPHGVVIYSCDDYSY